MYSNYCATVYAMVTNVNYPGYQATGIYVVANGITRYYDFTEGNCSFCIDNVGSNVTSFGWQIYVGDVWQHFVSQSVGYLCGVGDRSCSSRYTGFVTWSNG